MKRLFTFLAVLSPVIVILAFFIYPERVSAATWRNGTDVTIGKNDVIEGNLYASGNTLTIDGTVNGDIFCASQTIRINGVVNGDIICVGQTINVTGTVDGNIRSAAQQITLAGRVTRNVTVAGQTVDVKPEATLAGELAAAGQSLHLSGTVTRDALVAGQDVDLNGNMHKDALIAGNTIIVNQHAKVGGNLKYYSDLKATVPSGVVSGQVTHVEPEQKPPPTQTSANGLGNLVRSIMSALIVGLFLSWMWPQNIKQVALIMRERPLRSIGWGALVSLLLPVLVILLLITVVGISAAVILGLAGLTAILLSRIFAAVVVGQWLVTKYMPKNKDDLFWETLIGIVVAWIIFSLPIVGFFLSLVAMWWGVGGLFETIKPTHATKS